VWIWVDIGMNVGVDLGGYRNECRWGVSGCIYEKLIVCVFSCEYMCFICVCIYVFVYIYVYCYCVYYYIYMYIVVYVIFFKKNFFIKLF